MKSRAAIIATTLACSNGSSDIDARVACPIGDLTLEPEVEIIHRDLSGRLTLTSSMAIIPMTLTDQGGHVLFAGVRAKNVDGCELRLTATMRDQCNNMILSRELREVTLEQQANGWGEPVFPDQATNYANVQVCPRVAAERDIEGEPYRLTIEIADYDGRRASVSTFVVPTCKDDEYNGFCLCECDVDFEVGGSCSAEGDGGTAPGTCPERPDGGT